MRKKLRDRNLSINECLEESLQTFDIPLKKLRKRSRNLKKIC